MKTRDQAIQNLAQACTLLGVSVDRVMRRAGLSVDALSVDAGSAPPEVYFRIWQALRDEAGSGDMEFRLAKSYAQGPPPPPVFGFSCAETLGAGLERFAQFKPLMGPKRLEVVRPGGAIEATLVSIDPSLPLPTSIGLFELVFLTELARSFTGETVTPSALSLPAPIEMTDEVVDFLGGRPRVGSRVMLAFSAEDAARPLVTRSPAVWAEIEPMLTKELNERRAAASVAERVRSVLTEMLPGGLTGADDVARRLNLSRRSLQRRLTEEGTSFQRVLSRTRSDLSVQYLVRSDFTLPEISYLLGFSDSSSFFRAFHTWQGVTPGEYRERHAERVA